MRTESMGTKVVPCNPTHGDGHSPFMKAIIGITTSPTFRSNSTPSVVQWRTTTSWGMWYFSLNNSIRAGVFTKRSNLPIVSLWNEEWLAEETVEVRSAKLTWGWVRTGSLVSGRSLNSLSCGGMMDARIRTLWWMQALIRNKKKNNVWRFL